MTVCQKSEINVLDNKILFYYYSISNTINDRHIFCFYLLRLKIVFNPTLELYGLSIRIFS